MLPRYSHILMYIGGITTDRNVWDIPLPSAMTITFLNNPMLHMKFTKSLDIFYISVLAPEQYLFNT